MSKQKTKIVHLASGDLWAGAEVQLFTLAKYLNRNEQLEISVILLNEGHLAEKLQAENVEVVILDESKYNFFSLYKKISKQLKAWQPHILHTHRQKENIIGAFAAKTLKIKSIRTIHGAPENIPTWLKPHKRIISYLDMWVAKNIQTKTISVSHELTERLISVIPYDKIITIENGVDLELLSPYMKTELVITSNIKIKIGIIGRLVPVKQIHLFLEMAETLVHSDSKWDFSFHIYGDGPLKNNLKSLINEKKLQNHAILEGHKSDIFDAIKELDFLLITSKHEGLPMTLLEAMAIGTPIISASVGGITKVLNNCGTLVSPVVSSCFTQKILHGLNNWKTTVLLSQKASKRIIESYSASINASEVCKLYLTEITSRKTGRSSD